MKALLSLLLTVTFVMSGWAQTEVLTNETIITLTKIGLDPSVIVTKIKNSASKFDVSTDALIDLNSKGVASEVITEMLKKDATVKVESANQVDLSDPNAMHRSGIYLYVKNDSVNPVRRMDATRVAGVSTSSGGYGGFSGSSETARLSGAYSKLQINPGVLVFYFYFNPADNSRPDWYSNASSPNEFVLVKFLEKGNERIFKTGGSSSNTFSSSARSGIPARDQVAFDYKEMADGVYRVTLKYALIEGEYAFVFPSSPGKVFDFGIRE